MTTHIVISRSDLFAALNGAYCAGCEGQPYSNPANEAPSGWLHIDQAPKDGTWVLVACKNPDGKGWITEICNCYSLLWHDANRARFGGKHPTHFLPLVTPE
jgi:hypothetical protein